MNRKQQLHSLHRSRGVTLIEILLVISSLVIMLSFAIPSMSTVTAKADMMAAVENVEYSIASARKTARRLESEVTMEFKSYAGEPGQVIAVTPGKHAIGFGVPEYRLPEGIELVTNQKAFVFDQRGLVENPGSIILVSRVDGSISETLPLE